MSVSSEHALESSKVSSMPIELIEWGIFHSIISSRICRDTLMAFWREHTLEVHNPREYMRYET